MSASVAPGEAQATVSLGVSALSDHETSLDDAVARADQALYLAKQHGRNQVRWASCEAQEHVLAPVSPQQRTTADHG